MNVAEIIKQRTCILTSIVDIAKKYTPYVEEVLRGYNDDAVKAYKSATQALEGNIEELNSFKTTQSLAEVAALYDIFERANTLVAAINSTATSDRYVRLAAFNVSDTKVQEIQQLRNDIVKTTAKLQTKSLADDGIIIPQIIADTNIEKNPGIGVLFVEDNPTLINKLTTSIMRFVYPKVSRDVQGRLDKVIEKQKDTLLSLGNRFFEPQQTGLHRHDFAGYNSDQGLHSYGLLPASESMPFEKLGFGPLADLEGNFIILDKSSSNPIEFNIKGIMEVEGALNPAAGLNKKFLERSMTIRRLSETGGRSTPVRVIGDKNADKFTVLDTLDGGHNWRQLITKDGEREIPRAVVAGFIDGPSMRPDNYNEIVCGAIFDKCYDPMADVILKSYEEMKFLHTPADAVKNALRYDLDHMIEQKVPFDNPKEFEDAVCSDRSAIEKLMLERLMSEDRRMLDNPEFALTFLSRLEGMVSSFIKEIAEKYVLARISAKTFSERRGEELQQHLMDTAGDIFSAAIDELDRNNTWTTYDVSLKEHFIFKKYLVI